MNKFISIALVDDEDLILEGMSLLLQKTKNINVVISANSGLGFLKALDEIERSKFPDIALIDVKMKPMDGFDLVESLNEKYPNLRTIIVSSYYETNIVGYMIKSGVSAFITKSYPKKNLIETIESVYKYGVFFTKKDQQMLLSYLKHKQKKPTISSTDTLSTREIEVLKLICKELTNQEIADQLFLSKRTIESHRQRILEKVGAKNTVGLIIYAVAKGIHPLPPA